MTQISRKVFRHSWHIPRFSSIWGADVEIYSFDQQSSGRQAWVMFDENSRLVDQRPDYGPNWASMLDHYQKPRGAP